MAAHIFQHCGGVHIGMSVAPLVHTRLPVGLVAVPPPPLHHPLAHGVQVDVLASQYVLVVYVLPVLEVRVCGGHAYPGGRQLLYTPALSTAVEYMVWVHSGSGALDGIVQLQLPAVDGLELLFARV
jgi:hypothetical protein